MLKERQTSFITFNLHTEGHRRDLYDREKKH